MALHIYTVKSGHVHLPEHAPWLGDFHTELLAFGDGIRTLGMLCASLGNQAVICACWYWEGRLNGKACVVVHDGRRCVRGGAWLRWLQASEFAGVLDCLVAQRFFSPGGARSLGDQCDLARRRATGSEPESAQHGLNLIIGEPLLVDGVTALKHKRSALAFHILQPFAERGHAVAQVNLGTVFLYGLGVRSDAEAAQYRFEAAAGEGLRPRVWLAGRPVS